MLVLLYVTATAAALRGLWSPCGLSMLSSLNPMSERARGHRFSATACWYVVGSIAGGALLGAGCAVGAFGFGRLDAPDTVGWALALAGAAVAVASDTGIGGWSLPTHPRQVDERWLDRYRRWIYASGYGIQIGSGFATYIMTAGVYLTALLAVVTGSPAQALTAGLTFGLVRGLGVLIAAPARDPRSLGAVIRRVDSWAGASAFAAAAACVGVATVAAWQLTGTLAAVAVAVALSAPVIVSGRDRAVGRRAA